MAILVDTGVWYAVFDARDRPYDRPAVERLAARIRTMSIIVPWPVTYETICSKFARNRTALGNFERFLKSSRIDFLDDSPYRDKAFDRAFASSLRGNRPLGLTDCLLREMLGCANLRIDYLATYNARDFYDVCAEHHVEIWPV
jgi:predicted nucleic acid-binding protein